MESASIEELLARIEKQPNDAELFVQLGNLYTRAGNAMEARDAFERALEIDPEDPFTHLYFGNFYYTFQMHTEALERFKHAAALLPADAVAYWAQGDAYRELGEYRLADQAYEQTVRVNPNNEQAKEHLEEWHRERAGNTSRTLRMISVAYENDQAATVCLLASRWLKDNPEDIGVIGIYAHMLYQMTRYDEAEALYQDAIARFPDQRWWLYCRMGQLNRYRGAFVAAAHWYEKAVEQAPQRAGSYVFLGAVQARQGKLLDAEQSHRQGTLCKEGPVDEAHYNLGLVLRGQGRLDAAAECFRKAIKITPSYADAIEALRDVESALALARLI